MLRRLLGSSGVSDPIVVDYAWPCGANAALARGGLAPAMELAIVHCHFAAMAAGLHVTESSMVVVDPLAATWLYRRRCVAGGGGLFRKIWRRTGLGIRRIEHCIRERHEFVLSIDLLGNRHESNRP
ncbi:MAG: hypothetical protein OXI01_23370 [Albidovulum sp.]|nr:hypothetical protein [Albidovulum sp.]